MGSSRNSIDRPLPAHAVSVPRPDGSLYAVCVQRVGVGYLGRAWTGLVLAAAPMVIASVAAYLVFKDRSGWLQIGLWLLPVVLMATAPRWAAYGERWQARLLHGRPGPWKVGVLRASWGGSRVWEEVHSERVPSAERTDTDPPPEALTRRDQLVADVEAGRFDD